MQSVESRTQESLGFSYVGQTDSYMGRRDLYTWGKQSYIHGAKRLIYMGQTDLYTWGKQTHTWGEQPKCRLKTEIAHTAINTWWMHNISWHQELWKNLFKNIPRLSIDNKLRQLSFEPLHRILVTNYYELQRFNISVDECIYCRSRNSIQHAFLEFFVGLSLSQEMIRMV